LSSLQSEFFSNLLEIAVSSQNFIIESSSARLSGDVRRDISFEP